MLSVNSDSTNAISFNGRPSNGRIVQELKMLKKTAKTMGTSIQNVSCKTQGKTIPKEIQYVDHSLLIGAKKDVSLHIKKLEAYLKENLPLLRQKFDDNNIKYDELNQRERRENREQNRKKGRDNE